MQQVDNIMIPYDLPIGLQLDIKIWLKFPYSLCNILINNLIPGSTIGTLLHKLLPALLITHVTPITLIVFDMDYLEVVVLAGVKFYLWGLVRLVLVTVDGLLFLFFGYSVQEYLLHAER